MKQIEKLGMMNTLPVDVIEIKGMSKDEIYQKFQEIEQSVATEHRRSGKGTFVHIYCSGRSALLNDQV